MRVFITGGTGFIGRPIVRTLQRGDHEVALLARGIESRSYDFDIRPRLIRGDLNDLDRIGPAIEDFDPEVAIHLAWEGIPDFTSRMSVLNLKNSIALFDFLTDKTSCKKILVSGSCFEYGNPSGSCAEFQATPCNSFFSWAKQSLYHYAALRCKEANIDLIWFRIFYAYGPGQRKESVIPSIIAALKRKDLPMIKNTFNANDFIYVEDVAKAFGMAVDKKIDRGIYNLGSGQVTQLIELCEIAEREMYGNSAITTQLKNKKLVQQTTSFWASMHKVKNVLGWEPTLTIQEGLRQCIALRDSL